MGIAAGASRSGERLPAPAPLQEDARVFSPENQCTWSFCQSDASAEISYDAVKLDLWHGGDYGVWM